MKTLFSILYVAGGVMLLAGAAIYITGWSLAPALYLIGATLFALGQLNTPLEADSPALRRLRRQQVLSSLLLVLAGVCMCLTHGNEWIVCLTIGAILQLYTAWRIPQEIERQL